MWTTMGYNEGIGDFNSPISYNSGRKLRPLVPRAPPIFTDHIINPISTHPSLNVTENGKRELNKSVVDAVVTSRWNPTPEQLRTLEELYLRGTRTPSAEQIQLITAQLRRYGKIEGKNVFYWFQNHKARERQKRRRHQLIGSDDVSNFETFERNELSGEKRTLMFDVEQIKNWQLPTNCRTISQELSSGSKIGKGGRRSIDAESIDDEIWVQFDTNNKAQELHQQLQNGSIKNATWHTMQLMSCPPPSSCSSNAHLINASTTTTITAAEVCRRMDKFYDLNSLDKDNDSTINTTATTTKQSQKTLQLFPLQSINEEDHDTCHHRRESMSDYQYFEFLPLKNN